MGWPSGALPAWAHERAVRAVTKQTNREKGELPQGLFVLLDPETLFDPSASPISIAGAAGTLVSSSKKAARAGGNLSGCLSQAPSANAPKKSKAWQFWLCRTGQSGHVLPSPRRPTSFSSRLRRFQASCAFENNISLRGATHSCNPTTTSLPTTSTQPNRACPSQLLVAFLARLALAFSTEKYLPRTNRGANGGCLDVTLLPNQHIHITTEHG